jgi:hypothetical protein
MDKQQPVSTQKNDPWIWVLVVLVVLCLCCVLIGITVGGYLLIKQKGVSLPIPAVQTFLPPSLLESTAVPPSAGGPIEVVPYAANMSSWPALAGLASGYQDTTTPGTRTWPIQVRSTDQTLLVVGWCAADQATLTQNDQHITWSVSIDGKTLPISALTPLDEPGQQGVCHSNIGGIEAWPVGEHTIRTTMHLDLGVNDGWSDYPAGDYVDVFQVTVAP